MQERQVARKLSIKDINTGNYIKIDRTESEESQYLPNYVEINGLKISRVNIIATVIDKFVSDNYATLTLDDGTDTIRCKLFDKMDIITNIEKGDIVNVIGKVKEFDDERYIHLETITKIDDPNYEILRNLELKLL
ncbi:MAG: hypothetical protein B6U88_00010 [Candidatus Aenigmarchaeota archaeon ex4484_56]|nr:MAG: hypothetical protein B6U88_00010 [Candidatus Aenigmarchaeota archaeon ex4484_56]